MPSVKQHYENLLGDVYAWFVSRRGDPFERGAAWLTRFGLDDADRYLDLGAGFGAHAVPLAGMGKSVTAVDFDPQLTRQLRANLVSEGDALRAPVEEEDLITFLRTAPRAHWDVILCLGDTVTHLPDADSVRELLALAHGGLVPGGRLALSYRDSSTFHAVGTDRFLEVARDAGRIMHCLLEPVDTRRLRVTDIVTDVTPDGSSTRISDYEKLRLPVADLTAWACKAGFTLEQEDRNGGMTALILRK